MMEGIKKTEIEQLQFFAFLLLPFAFPRDIKYRMGRDNGGDDWWANSKSWLSCDFRRITIIGEATKRLSKDFREQHPTIPWKEIAGMRDVITHDYNEVDLDEVWTIINENPPQLLAYIEPLTLPES